MKPGSPNGKQRSRGRNNMGGKKHIQVRTNQTFDSNGPDVRIRGNAHQVMEKYLALARDASSQGDRIAAENYYQHAEHYFRTINNYNANNPNANVRRPMTTPAEDQAIPQDSEDEGEQQGAPSGDEGQEQAVNA